MDQQQAPANQITIFYSYAHADERLRQQLETHLGLLRQQGIIAEWHDRQIVAGTDWAHEIDSHLITARVILLLISPDFIASNYCYGAGMDRAMQRHDIGEARVIPILLRPVADWNTAPFARLAVLPTNRKPITQWRNRDEAFVDVAAGIRRAIEDLEQLSANRPTRIDLQLWHVPYRRNPFFTGREDVLNQLQEHFTQAKTAVLTQSPAITGLGGVGKTQIAVEYAYRYKAAYRYILWVTAATRDTLITSFLDLAHRLSLPEKDEQDQNITVQAVKCWLEQHDHWLLIVDNADDLSLAYDFFPTGDKGHILLTTRTQALGSLATKIDVEKMDTEEGMLFLLRRAKVLTIGASLSQASETDRVAAEMIVKEMDGLPLALDQAGAYIEETQCSVSAYLVSYRQRKKRTLRTARWNRQRTPGACCHHLVTLL